MAKRKNLSRKHAKRILPIDQRILPDIISFSHVKGIAYGFLLVEMICSVLVVLGTVTLVILQTFFR